MKELTDEKYERIRSKYEALLTGDPREPRAFLGILQIPFNKKAPQQELVDLLMPELVGKDNFEAMKARMAAEQPEQVRQ